MGIVESKTFKSGNSVAVRLPKELGFGPNIVVTIEQHGSTLTVKPLIDPVEEKRKVQELVAALRALGPPIKSDQSERIEFPDRPGL